MLVQSKEMLEKARAERYAVGSFNIFNMESARAIIAAAEEEQAPVMLQVWSGFAQSPGLDTLGAIAIAEAKKATVPVAVHLDHGASLDHVGQAVRAGYTSVMLDGSSLPIEKNIAATKAVVDFCKGIGIPVEGEIGHVGGGEYDGIKDEIIYTRPDDAVRFWKETGVDFVAVSIGTSHGTYDFQPQLNIDLLQLIAKRVSAPLVLHGSSYTPDDQLAEAVENGISKINVATEISDTMIRAMRDHARNLEGVQYANQITDVPYQKVTEIVRHKIRLFGGSGKA